MRPPILDPVALYARMTLDQLKEMRSNLAKNLAELDKVIESRSQEVPGDA